MTQAEVDTQDQPGSVEYLVIEFPPDRQDFTGEMRQELERLSQSGTVKILRLLIAVKNTAGEVVVEVVGPDEPAGGSVAMAGDVAAIMAEDDLAAVTQRMDPGTVVGVVVWENTWAAGFVAAAHRAGGHVVANGRIPAEAIIAPGGPAGS